MSLLGLVVSVCVVWRGHFTSVEGQTVCLYPLWRFSQHAIVVEKIGSSIQQADMFTKALPIEVFERLRKLLMGW